jgi:methylmalonyl-CoA mutase N-terminal domain/subunit
MSSSGGDAAAKTTPSGIPVKAVYRPSDADVNYTSDIGEPGEWPYTRGVQPTMYRGRVWTMRQYAGFGTARETNERFRHLLDAGQTGLSVAFDLPTQMGLDSDSPRSHGEVGRAGVAIDTVDDMHRLFEAIPLGTVSTSMTINATAATLLALTRVMQALTRLLLQTREAVNALALTMLVVVTLVQHLPGTSVGAMPPGHDRSLCGDRPLIPACAKA